MVAIRPEEKDKKVIVRVVSNCPHEKHLRHYRVSVTTNLDPGGVVVPFEVYAESWNDPELIFYELDEDGTVGEELGKYIPPIDAAADRQSNEMTELASAIKMLAVAALGNNYPPGQMHKLLGQMNVDAPPLAEVPIDTPLESPIDTGAIIQKAHELVTMKWNERIAAIEEITDVHVLQAISDELKNKSSLGKTNKEILGIVTEKLLSQQGEYIIIEEDTSDISDEDTVIKELTAKTETPKFGDDLPSMADIQALHSLKENNPATVENPNSNIPLSDIPEPMDGIQMQLNANPQFMKPNAQPAPVAQTPVPQDSPTLTIKDEQALHQLKGQLNQPQLQGLFNVPQG